MSLILSSDAATNHGRVRLQEPRAAEQIIPLLRLTLRHSYGASALAGLRWTPSQATNALCLQHGLLLSTDAQGLALYAPQRALPSLWQAQREEGCDYLLAWRLDCGEALFTLATTDDAPRHVLLRLAPCSALDTVCETWCASMDQTHELQLAARLCEWKYLLLGDWASLAASGQVEDLRIAATYSTGSACATLQFRRDTAQETLPDGRLAWVYRSPEPLPLAEQSSCRIALSDVGSTPARVLMGALPHGAPRSLQREKRAGDTHWVTEIFLIR
jgi:hypothetical protein